MTEPTKFIQVQSTRYQGSKRKLIPWLYKIFQEIEFNTALDVFGGTGVVSYLLKCMNKSVTYNDYLSFNYQIGLSLIENQNVLLNDNDIKNLVSLNLSNEVGCFITNNFKNIYFKEKENIWLDNVISNIHNMNHYDIKTLKFKKALALNALYQSCLVKRPYNLFHRKNLSMRTRKVVRTFGNKTTWEKSFDQHFINFSHEINNLVHKSSKTCKCTCKSVFDIKYNDYDLVYMDPPYLNKVGSNETSNYFNVYHFLEGLTIYPFWSKKINYNSQKKMMICENENLFRKDHIYEVYDMIFEKFRKSILVLSYKSDGIPSIDYFVKKLKKMGKKVNVRSIDYTYSLRRTGNNSKTKEYIIIAKN